MKIKLPISIQLLGFLVAHLAIALILPLLIFGTRFPYAWNAIFASPVGERVEQTAWLLVKDLMVQPQADWDKTVRGFEQLYGVKFYVFDITGREVAGDSITLPREVLDSVALPHFLHPPPLPNGFGPPQGGPSLGPPQGGPRFGPPQAGPGLGPTQGAPGLGPKQGGPGPGPPQDAPELGPPRGAQGFGPPQAGPGAGPPHDAPELGPPRGAQGFGPPRGAQGFGPPPGAPELAAPPILSSNRLDSLRLPADRRTAPGMAKPPVPDSMTPPPVHPGPAINRFFIHTADPDKFWLLVRLLVPDPTAQSLMPGTVIASADSLWQTNLLFDLRPALMIIAAMLLFSIVFWLPFAIRLTRELTTLNKATQRIAEGRFDTRVKANDVDEFGSLAHSVNAMAQRLNVFVTQEQRFLGDIAHELGSPLGRLQLAVELLQSASPDSHERIVNDIKEDVLEMTALVNELLDFSKAGLTGKATELTTVDLKSLLPVIVDKLSAQSLVRLDLIKCKPVQGDETLLNRAFSNILRNAISYASDFGIIEVRGDTDPNQLIITVTDNGPGVPPDTVQQLTEPFFRPESSRARNTGGAGLGLAIVKTCVHACQGELSIRNRQPRGLVVEVRLPLAKS